MAIVHERGWDPNLWRVSPWHEDYGLFWDRYGAYDDFPSPCELSAHYEERVAGLDVPQLRFVAAPPKKPKRRRARPVVLAELYEGRIAERFEVPTRERDWHDFFNALAFIAFPHAKWALHRRAYEIMRTRLSPTATRLPGARTREQDALALFDEGGIALAVSPEHVGELPDDPNRFDAAVLQLIEARAARALPFGHALFEHMVAGVSGPLGALHVVSLAWEGLTNAALFDALDLALASALSDPALFVIPSAARGLSLEQLVSKERRR